MLSKSLIQFSVDGQGCVPSLLFDLRPNYGGGNEDNGDLPQKIPGMYCYKSVPPTLQHVLENERKPLGINVVRPGKRGTIVFGKVWRAQIKHSY